MKISNAMAIAGLNAKTALLNVGGAGRIDIMSGTQPADVSVAITIQIVIGSLTLSATAFAGATDSGGSATALANAIADTTAGSNNTATWFRAYDGNGLACIDGSAGLAGNELVLTDETFTAGQPMGIDSWSIVQAE